VLALTMMGMAPADGAEPVVVAYTDSGWHVAARVQAVVYDDGAVVAANRPHRGGDARTPWPNTFVVGQLTAEEVDALVAQVGGSIAGHDGRIEREPPPQSGAGGGGGCNDCDVVYVLALSSGDAPQTVGYYGSGPGGWFAAAWDAVLDAAERATSPYRAEHLALLLDPVWSPTGDPDTQQRRPPRRTRDLFTVPLQWEPHRGVLRAVTTRAQFDAWFPMPCGERSVEDLVRRTSRRWCSLVRVGDTIGKLYARELLPGHERWEPCAPYTGEGCATPLE
jgi:hypothetical protein